MTLRKRVTRISKQLRKSTELTLYGPQRPRRVLWQRAKTRIKCHIVRNFIRISTVRLHKNELQRKKYIMGLVFGVLRTTKAQTSLRIRAV